MGPELLTAESLGSLLYVYRDLLIWLAVLMTWMGELLVALSALGAILYIVDQEAEDTVPTDSGKAVFMKRASAEPTHGHQAFQEREASTKA